LSESSSQNDNSAAQFLCVFCDTVNGPADRYCKECGGPLLCPHCGLRILTLEPALMAMETGFMSRVKKVDPVFLLLRQGGLEIWSISRHECMLTFEAKQIAKAKFSGRYIVAELPPLPQSAWENAGGVLSYFKQRLKRRHFLFWLNREEMERSEWRGITIVLRDGAKFFFAIEQGRMWFWKDPVRKLSKAITVMARAEQ